MTLKAYALIGGDVQKRNPADFYPTPTEVTQALINYLSNGVQGLNVWEPACGNGQMAEVLEKNGAKVICSDIFDYEERAEASKNWFQHDFINDDCDLNYCNFDMIITNPPFKLAEEFIWKSYSYGKPFAMLLKSNYWQAKSRYDLFQETKPSFILPLSWRPNFCPERGSAPTMDFAWTVWKGQSCGDRFSQRCGKTVYDVLPKPTNKKESK